MVLRIPNKEQGMSNAEVDTLQFGSFLHHSTFLVPCSIFPPNETARHIPSTPPRSLYAASCIHRFAQNKKTPRRAGACVTVMKEKIFG